MPSDRRKPKPVPAIPPGAPKDAVRREFARRLQDKLHAKHWNQSDLARAMEKELGRTFGRDNVSNYLRGVSIPRGDILTSLAKVLGVTTADLLPAPSRPLRNPPIEFKALDEGNAWLKINMAVPIDVAIKVMNLVQPGEK